MHIESVHYSMLGCSPVRCHHMEAKDCAGEMSHEDEVVIGNHDLSLEKNIKT